MWETLHNAAFIMDGHGINPEPLFSVLRILLPCVHCRNSYQEFYTQQGPPRKGHAAEWMYEMHRKVNRKLLQQRLQKIANIDVVHLMNNADELLAEPSMLVLQKRFMVNRESPFFWTSLSTVILAMALSFAPENALSLYTFIREIQKIVTIGDQEDARDIVWKLDMIQKVLDTGDSATLRRMAEVAKYSKVDVKGHLEPVAEDVGHDRSGLIKAGSCLGGTCK